VFELNPYLSKIEKYFGSVINQYSFELHAEEHVVPFRGKYCITEIAFGKNSNFFVNVIGMIHLGYVCYEQAGFETYFIYLWIDLRFSVSGMKLYFRRS
jgi:hypothetical protein